MKKFERILLYFAPIVIIAGCFFAVSCGEPNAEQNTPEQKASPGLSLIDADGNTVMLSDFVGKTVVINFWATWCSPCVGELPEFYDVYKEYSDRVEFLFVNIQEASDEEHVKAFLADNGYELPLYFDPSLELQMRFDVTAIPTTVFIAACGEYDQTQVGSMRRDELIAIIEDLIPKG